jgi:hypothetical protein
MAANNGDDDVHAAVPGFGDGWLNDDDANSVDNFDEAGGDDEHDDGPALDGGVAVNLEEDSGGSSKKQSSDCDVVSLCHYGCSVQRRTNS